MSAFTVSLTRVTYPVVNDRWGATDVATLSLHFILFSASLTASQNFNHVHSAMFFSQRFFWRPLFAPPCTVPCKIVLASPDDLDTCPNHFNLRFFTVVKISSWNTLYQKRTLNEDLNGVNRQTSNGLKFNRQPSKKVMNFLPSTVKNAD